MFQTNAYLSRTVLIIGVLKQLPRLRQQGTGPFLLWRSHPFFAKKGTVLTDTFGSSRSRRELADCRRFRGFAYRENTILPPTIVIATWRFSMFFSGHVRMSSMRTTISANFPTSIEPLLFSSKVR